VEYTRNASALADQLGTIPRDDHATWAKAAREVSGAFAAWSYRLEATPGPLAAAAAELSRTAQLRAPRQHSKPVALPSIAGNAMLFMAASSKNKTAAQTALMVQLINTASAVYEMQPSPVGPGKLSASGQWWRTSWPRSPGPCRRRFRSVPVGSGRFRSVPGSSRQLRLQQWRPGRSTLPGAEWSPSVPDQRCQRHLRKQRRPRPTGPADAIPGRASTDKHHHELQGEHDE
jgi:hypothetical protein